MGSKAPVLECVINGKSQDVVIDTGAVITVFKKSHRNLTPSKLRLKSATSHKAILYGPVETDIIISGFNFKYRVYEAEIEENLLGYDFLESFGATIKTQERMLEFNVNIKITSPFRIGHAKSKGQFRSGEVYYTVRSENRTVLKPFVESKITTVLKTDCSEGMVDETAKLLLESDPDFDMEWSSMDSDLSNPGTSAPRHAEIHRTTISTDVRVRVDPLEPQLDSKNSEVRVSVDPMEPRLDSKSPESKSKSDHSKSKSKSKPQYFHKELIREGKVHLGVFANSLASGNKVSRLSPTVAVQSGLVPCITAPIDVTLQNLGDHCVEIPKYAVLGEVYLVHPVEYHNSVTEEEDSSEYLEYEEEKEDFDMPINSVVHEVAEYNDAEYDPEPRNPIPGNEPLPQDLQDLVNRCTDLDSTQRTKVEQTLRKHRDVFAKDNLTFGKCPWLKFRIDTGDHPPIKLNARPVPLHYRKSVYETFMKYLQQGAIRPSQSAWASPTLCVLKKTGEVRVCIDYRALNAITRVPATHLFQEYKTFYNV